MLMKFSNKRIHFLGLFAAFLILIQSVFATGLPVHPEKKDTRYHQTEVQQKVPADNHYVEVTNRVTVAAFLFYWMVKAFTIDTPIIEYQNCKAFFVNPSSFNVYYVFVSALAP